MSDKKYDKASKRPCAFTGTKTIVKKRVIPKKFLSEDEMTNWCNYAPSNEIYRNFREDKLPDELEMQANEVFCQLELARLRVAYFEAKLEKIQNQILYKLNPAIKAKIAEQQATESIPVEEKKKMTTVFDLATMAVNLRRA